jgi:hypothetical protein
MVPAELAAGVLPAPVGDGAAYLPVTTFASAEHVTRLPLHPDAVARGILIAGQIVGNRYHVIRLIGAGGMGNVYQAWDAELGIAVALKMISTVTDPAAAASLERRLKRELLLARKVTHKHVVRIHDLGDVEGTKYITMPGAERYFAADGDHLHASFHQGVSQIRSGPPVRRGAGDVRRRFRGPLPARSRWPLTRPGVG